MQTPGVYDIIHDENLPLGRFSKAKELAYGNLEAILKIHGFATNLIIRIQKGKAISLFERHDVRIC